MCQFRVKFKKTFTEVIDSLKTVKKQQQLTDVTIILSCFIDFVINLFFLLKFVPLLLLLLFCGLHFPQGFTLHFCHHNFVKRRSIIKSETNHALSNPSAPVSYMLISVLSNCSPKVSISPVVMKSQMLHVGFFFFI